jgi:hypothetical protein
VTILAHAGHVLVDLMYVAPLVVVAGAMAIAKGRERRKRRE